jgi:hypothetical protein
MSSILSLLGGNSGSVQSLSGVPAKAINAQIALSELNKASVFATSVCQTNCTQLTNNITVIVSPGAYIGPITFTQQCEITDVNCAINSLVDAGIKSTLTTMGNADFNKLSTKPLFQVTPESLKSADTIDETIKNNVFQMISSSCIFETNQVLANNYVYVGTGATTGAISFAQTSTISSTDCAIDVVAKAGAYTVDGPSNGSGLLTIIIIIVIIIIVVGVVLLIVFLILGGDKKLATFFRGNKPKQLHKDIYTLAATPNRQLHPISTTV